MGERNTAMLKIELTMLANEAIDEFRLHTVLIVNAPSTKMSQEGA